MITKDIYDGLNKIDYGWNSSGWYFKSKIEGDFILMIFPLTYGTPTVRFYHLNKNEAIPSIGVTRASYLVIAL